MTRDPSEIEKEMAGLLAELDAAIGRRRDRPTALKDTLQRLLSEAKAKKSCGWFSHHALQAVAAIAWFEQQDANAAGNELVNDRPVPVPWWVVETIASRWVEYQRSRNGMKLGVAFQLEGKKSGAHPLASVQKTTIDLRFIALSIGWLRKLITSKRSRIVPYLARHHNCSEAQVLKAWRLHRQEVLERLPDLLAARQHSA